MKRRERISKMMRKLVSSVLVAVMAVTLIPAFGKTAGAASVSGKNWMSAIPDNTYLGQINIPGTHDSATKNTDFTYSAGCQGSGFDAQLDYGVRFFDARLAVDGSNSLVFKHGIVFCRDGGYGILSPKLTFDKVLNMMYNFLKSNPSETIILCVKQEDGNESVATFQKILKSYIDKNSSKWLLTDSIPTLGQARGKIVLLRRFDDKAGYGKNAGIDFNWSDQGGTSKVTYPWGTHSKSKYNLFVQDRYEFSTSLKWDAFTYTHNQFAGKIANQQLVVNFLSTTTGALIPNPSSYAKTLNAKLKDFTLKKQSGWVVIDYVDRSLAEKIYKSNF